MENENRAIWAAPGPLTELTADAALPEPLPEKLPDLCELVQGLLLNIFWMEELEDDFEEERLEDVDLRSASQILARIRELDQQHLQIPRPAEKRVISNARGYALLLTSLLRRQGVPARLRCGFSAYFKPGLYIDHWVAEIWAAEKGRWVLVDAQLDEEQRENFRIGFSPFDVPRNMFLLAGEAWQLCIEDEVDPDLFGLYEYSGMWFIRGSLIRDFLALRKIELLPWDSFGLIAKEEELLTEEDLDLLDTLTEITSDASVSPQELRAVYEAHPSLQPPEEWGGF
ncbi:MAG: hypothetical protein JXA25_14380 [Anaerolineales bacterium]|nr:hypothetical protein [Anaerolineales bacterium]